MWCEANGIPDGIHNIKIPKSKTRYHDKWKIDTDDIICTLTTLTETRSKEQGAIHLCKMINRLSYPGSRFVLQISPVSRCAPSWPGTSHWGTSQTVHRTSESIMGWRWGTPWKGHGTSGSIMGWTDTCKNITSHHTTYEDDNDTQQISWIWWRITEMYFLKT